MTIYSTNTSTIPMRTKARTVHGSDKGPFRQEHHRQLTEEETQAFEARIFVKEDIIELQRLGGEIVRIYEAATCVLTADSRFYLSPGADRHEEDICHASFNSGEPVCFAGELCANQGRTLTFTNKSGHYRPEGDAEI